MTQVFLVCGPSGAGKTMLSYPLARRAGAALVEVDDLVIAAQTLTTAGQQPELHYWDENPDAEGRLPVQQIVDMQIATARVLAPAVNAVIANHVQTATPVVIEGDYLLPELGADWGDVVRAVVVHEPDLDQLIRNYAAREPEAGIQRKRAECSLAYGDWLAGQAVRHGVPVLRPRPWVSADQRVNAALRVVPQGCS
ncbi:AAA family ATPase [Kibdelosporangium phytohabitans]|uniref:AAA family ATPase n=1 Tax=Kibdelosporangium phytohabitans TaxID=860235 RepID=UPI0019FD483E|nr:AAA family ATPase [Kibdelosporangium phytohabitans]MBE1463350.1 2-phosphoglycerate kinase [Kibdelosporangium phytohabitans]